MSTNEHVFREYDIRGVVGTEITPEFATKLGRAYSTHLQAHGITQGSIAIGYDCRVSSPELSAALAEGIAAEGFDVVMYGMGPTPQLYFAVFHNNHAGGIQVTGSHNPPDMNGFKMMSGKKTLSGAAIQDIKQRYLTLDEASHTASVGVISEEFIRATYLESLAENVRPFMGKRHIKVVVDAGNGVGGLVGPELLRSLGAEVIELYCDPDGTFPNHHPDPTVLENIVDLQDAVRQYGADLGIGWDGDADRIGAVDEQGNVIYGDMLVLLYALDILKRHPGATIIGDVKCSSRLFSEVAKAGGQPIMYKTGHSLMKSKLLEENAALAGEMSGHIFFNDRFFGFDDALYASARLIEILSNSDQPLSAHFRDLPLMYSTPEIRFDCPEEKKFSVPQILAKHFTEYPVDCTDGIRINFEKGWGLVRASNTQPVLVMRFEASDEDSLRAYESLVREKLQVAL